MPELPHPSFGGVVPSPETGSCRFSGLRDDCFSCAAKHSPISPSLQSLPSSSSFSLPPSSQLPPENCRPGPGVETVRVGQGRGKEKATSPHSAMKHQLSPGSDGSSAASARGQQPPPALLSSQLGFSSQAGDTGQGRCSSPAARTEATEMSYSQGRASSETAYRLPAERPCVLDFSL